ncbi:MAG: putative quinol monooxygenase [Pseudomonadota bacterium]
MGAVVVIARVEALPGHESQVEELLRWQVGPTLRETGCINYDLHRDNALPNVFWFHETWASPADLDAHAVSEHLQLNRERLKPHVAGPSQVHKATKLD